MGDHINGTGYGDGYVFLMSACFKDERTNERWKVQGRHGTVCNELVNGRMDSTTGLGKSRLGDCMV